jgi:riboflavin biosynthesis pyrimidine reductase
MFEPDRPHAQGKDSRTVQFHRIVRGGAYVKTQSQQLLTLPRRLRRRPEPEPGKPARRRRHSAARMGVHHTHVPEDVRQRRRRHRRGRRLRGAWQGGGVATIRQYLRAGLVDELHLAIAPTLLGSGEALFAGIDLPSLGYQCTEHAAIPNAKHVVLTRQP